MWHPLEIWRSGTWVECHYFTLWLIVMHDYSFPYVWQKKFFRCVFSLNVKKYADPNGQILISCLVNRLVAYLINVIDGQSWSQLCIWKHECRAQLISFYVTCFSKFRERAQLRSAQSSSAFNCSTPSQIKRFGWALVSQNPTGLLLLLLDYILLLEYWC